MCPGFRHQQTNRPEVDAGINPAGTIENSRRTVTGSTTAGKAEAYMEYHKRMNRPFSLATAAGFLQSALRTADREPMGGFLWGLPFSVRQE
jgi:hypothetical protein